MHKKKTVFSKMPQRLIALSLTAAMTLPLFLTGAKLPVRADDQDGKPADQQITAVPVDPNYFPDPNFLTYVSINFDANSDGVLSDEELVAITYIDVDSKDIISLKGIEYFPNLDYLDAFGNELESIDVSANTKLRELNVGFTHVKNLDLSHNPELQKLECTLTDIKELDVTHNPKLVRLSCVANDLTSLDLSQNSELEELYVHSNDLSKLDLSGNPKLREVNITHNNIVELNIYPCPLLCDLIAKVPPQLFIAGVNDYYYSEYTAPDGTRYSLRYGTGVKIIYERTYSVSVKAAEHGVASASCEAAVPGTVVTLSATAYSGYVFKEWIVRAGNVTIENSSFVMGKEDVEIEAVFEAMTTEPTFEDFIERLYTVALGRASEPEGKAFWNDRVVNEGYTGADCARFFLLDAPEFMNRNLTPDAFVETLYMTFFGRASDEEGKIHWMTALSNGYPRTSIVSDFIESTEWCNICATYGVRSGAQWHYANFPSKNAMRFATRLYTYCLGRDPEDEGVEYWALALTNDELSGVGAAYHFFTSSEFVGKRYSNSEFVRRMYLTYMDREPDQQGMEYWVARLESGLKRSDAVIEFGFCPEFEAICKRYGILRGELG